MTSVLWKVHRTIKLDCRSAAYLTKKNYVSWCICLVFNQSYSSIYVTSKLVLVYNSASTTSHLFSRLAPDVIECNPSMLFLPVWVATSKSQNQRLYGNVLTNMVLQKNQLE